MRGGIGVASVLDNGVDDLLEFLIRGILEKLLLESAFVKLDEALHAFAPSHHQDQLDDFLLVLAEVLQS